MIWETAKTSAVRLYTHTRIHTHVHLHMQVHLHCSMHIHTLTHLRIISDTLNMCMNMCMYMYIYIQTYFAPAHFLSVFEQYAPCFWLYSNLDVFTSFSLVDFPFQNKMHHRNFGPDPPSPFEEVNILEPRIFKESAKTLCNCQISRVPNTWGSVKGLCGLSPSVYGNIESQHI